MTDYIVERNLCYLPLRKRYDLCSLPLHKKYRGHFEIVALILEAIKNGGRSRFSIMKNTDINFVQLKKYLNSLVEIGLIYTFMEDGRALYRASEKGLAFLRQYHVLGEILLSPYVRAEQIKVSY